MTKKHDKAIYLAEAIATFTLIFIGAGSILVNELTNGALGIVGIALAHGLAIMVMVYATAHISGAHINPAVTIGMWITKKLDTLRAIGYIVSQLIGAVLGAICLKIIYANFTSEASLGTPSLAQGISPGIGILMEAILTFILVFVIFGVAVDKKAGPSAYGLAIGFTVTLDALMGGALTGAAMNPARAFGPALISGFWLNHFVYWVGPILGGILGAIVYDNTMLEG